MTTRNLWLYSFANDDDLLHHADPSHQPVHIYILPILQFCFMVSFSPENDRNSSSTHLSNKGRIKENQLKCLSQQSLNTRALYFVNRCVGATAVEAGDFRQSRWRSRHDRLKSVCIQQITIYQINFLRTKLKGDDSSDRSKDAREEFKEWEKIIGWRREDEGGKVYVGVLQKRLWTLGNRETSYDYRDRRERSADKSRPFLRTHCPQKWMSHKKGFIYQWCMVVRRSKNETW